MAETRTRRWNVGSLLSVLLLLLLPLVCASCAGDTGDDSKGPPQLSPAVGAPLATCENLATQFTYAGTQITSASTVAAGAESVGGNPIGAHCRVTGKMNERISDVDGKTYAIGFEMRMPLEWNGRFFYQGNGGVDGNVAKALGAVSGGGPVTNALHQGFAVISSDAGHPTRSAAFGIDPQARLDYGYQAVQTLTPMAKALIAAAYGKGPDRSYIGGTSNGGRHTMVAAARIPAEYDGYLASAPGFNLPKAAVAQLFGAQKYAEVAEEETDLSTAIAPVERTSVANAILARCDGLDGAVDGLVNDIEGCAAEFDLITDVPTCAGNRDGTCLTPDQKSMLTAIYSGARNSRGEPLYSDFPWDPGLTSSGWAQWEFSASVTNRDPVAVGFIFQVPPVEDVALDTDPALQLAFALNFNMDTDAPKIFATDAIYTENSMSFMTPPNPTDLSTLRDRGAKLLVVQGACDPVFSVNDTRTWYEGLTAANGGNATRFARFFRVPSMSHSSGGPATDQFDALTALVGWVEQGVAPDRIIATARGEGNPGGWNKEVPAGWAPDRTRPLCPYPQIAVYKGTGSLEVAESFTCQ